MAVSKCSKANSCYTTTNYYICNTTARIECPFTYLSHIVSNSNSCKTCTIEYQLILLKIIFSELIRKITIHN